AMVYHDGSKGLAEIKANERAFHQFGIDLQGFQSSVLKTQGIGADFQIRGNQQLIYAHADMMRKLYADLSELKNMAIELEMNDGMADVAQEIQAYGEGFRQLTEQRQLIGLTQQNGLRGVMRKTAHAMEALALAEGGSKLSVSILQIRRHEKDFLSRKTEKYVSKLHAELAHASRLLQQARLTQQDKRALRSAIKKYRHSFDDIVTATQRVELLFKKLYQHIDATEPILSEALFDAMLIIEEKKQQAELLSNELENNFLFALLFVALIVLTSIAYIARSIIRPLQYLLERMIAIGSGRGDLRQRLDAEGKDEMAKLAQAMNGMMDMISEMIGNARQGSVQVAGSSNQIAASMREQEATVTQQVATTHEIAASSKEIAATATSLLHNMEGVVRLADDAAASASAGQEKIELLEKMLSDIQAASVGVSSKLVNLNEKAAAISHVATSIVKVADQTNLLSLNAAIEAEKAGEHGRGFSVVAQEIRHLADQTATASIDIEAIISAMQSSVSEGVMSMEQCSKKIYAGVDTGSQIGQQLAQVIKQVQELAPMVALANESLADQANGAEGISISIFELQGTSQQTADMVMRTGHAITVLNEAASDMQSLLSEFQIRDTTAEN
ncbi:MAG: methyl-accepting chemotaxis protein, partial [Mariprofundus sp.]|nr:methyl-accepting chemotaxis protein [Mariprofundus sp.]